MNEEELRHLAEEMSPYLPQVNSVETSKNFLTPPPQPTGTQVIEKATNEGLKAKRQTPFDWNLTSTQRPLVDLIMQAKNQYSALDNEYQKAIQAQNDLTTLEKSPELRQQYMATQGWNDSQFNDFLTKQKTTAAENLQKIQQGRNIAHTDAEYIRELARRRGLTDEQLDYFGSGATLEEANRALANNDLNAVFNLRDKYQMNSDDYYEKMYSEYREQGMSPPRAANYAADAAAKYKAERLAALGDGLSLYGRTNGALNDTGIDILSKMAQDNPEATNINLNAYAKPQDEYSNAFKYQMAQAMHAMGLEDKQIAAMLNMDLEKLKQAEQNYRTNLIQDRTDARTQFEEEGRNSRADATNQIKIAEYNLKAKELEDKLAKQNSSGLSADNTKEALKNYDDLIKNYKNLAESYPEDSEEREYYLELYRETIEEKNIVIENPNATKNIDFDKNNPEQFVSEAVKAGWSYKQIQAVVKDVIDSNTLRKIFEKYSGR